MSKLKICCTTLILSLAITSFSPGLEALAQDNIDTNKSYSLIIKKSNSTVLDELSKEHSVVTIKTVLPKTLYSVLSSQNLLGTMTEKSFINGWNQKILPSTFENVNANTYNWLKNEPLISLAQAKTASNIIETYLKTLIS